MVIRRIGRKRKSRAASAAEPPALTPAAGIVPDKSSDNKPSLYEFLRNSGYLIDRTSADLIQLVLEMPGIKAVLLEGPPGVGKLESQEGLKQ